MSLIYAFNGDADGLCALQQLRLVSPQASVLITGVKRDIKLLKRVDAREGDEVIVLDISLDSNRADLERLLANGASVRYFDHHYAGEPLEHPGFEPHIDTAPNVCTSILVDRYLDGRHRSWAITAAFGDSLTKVGSAMAQAEGIDPQAAGILERLGVCLNYNAYGESLGDLHFDPVELAEQMLPYDDPLAFATSSEAFAHLEAGYQEDMGKARALKPLRRVPGATVVVLPNEAWARRAIGVLANELMHAIPGSAIAILSPKSKGGYTASVRVPSTATMGADQFCLQFETGGGRRGAGGVNDLPESEMDHFASRFEECFQTR